jgi:hypothetical protein
MSSTEEYGFDLESGLALESQVDKCLWPLSNLIHLKTH